MKKVLALVLALAIVIGGIVGCASPSPSPAAQAPAAPAESAGSEAPAASGTQKAAFITQALSNESQAYAWKQFQQYCGEYGFEMTVFEGQNDVQNEAKAVSTCIAQGYKAIFINPSDINAIVPSLMEAKEAGLIVGMFSSDIAEEHWDYRDFFCGVDDTMAGETAGQAFKDAFPNGATIVEVGGQAGHDAQIKRHDGFMKAIEGSNITMLDSQNCTGWVTADAMAITEDFIVKYGDKIQGVFCHWDNGATGVIEALKNANMTDVFVVGVDGCRAGFDQVKAGTQAVSIGQSFTNMAIQSLKNARAAIDGQPFEKINFIPLDVVTPKTVETLPYPEW